MRIRSRKPIANREAAEETFQDMQPWLMPWMARAVQKGTDEDCVVTAAHDAFFYAYERYDPKRGVQFSTVMTQDLRRKLIDEVRICSNRKRVGVYNKKDIDMTLCPTKPRHNWAEKESEMSPDAKLVAGLALDPPVFLEWKPNCLATLRTAIRNALLEMGWTHKRIRQAFTDLVNALR